MFRWWREGRGLEQACLASPGAEQYCSTLNSDCDSRNARGKAAGQVRADQGRHELPTALPYIAPKYVPNTKHQPAELYEATPSSTKGQVTQSLK